MSIVDRYKLAYDNYIRDLQSYLQKERNSKMEISKAQTIKHDGYNALAYIIDDMTYIVDELHHMRPTVELRTRNMKELMYKLGIAKVIFNDKATIVYLTTGEKGVAIKGDTEEFDPVIGLSVAYALAESGVSKKVFKGIVNKHYEKKVK